MEIVEVEIEWTGTKRHAELLISSISPDDPESFLAEVIESKDGAKLIIRNTNKTTKKGFEAL